MWGLSLTHPVLVSFLIGGVSLTHPVLPSFLSREFLLHIRCWLHFYLWVFSYTSHVGFTFYLGSCVGYIFIGGVSLTYPVLGSFLSRVFLLHIPCWVHFYRGSFSYRSNAGFTFLWGSFSYTSHFLFLLFFNLGSFSYTSRAGFIFIWGVSLKHLVLASFLCGEFLLHIIKN